MHGCPIFRWFSGSELEIARQDTDDDVGLAIEDDRLAEDVRLAAIVLLPRRISQQHRARGGKQVFARVEIAAEDGGNAEGA